MSARGVNNHSGNLLWWSSSCFAGGEFLGQALPRLSGSTFQWWGWDEPVPSPSIPNLSLLWFPPGEDSGVDLGFLPGFGVIAWSLQSQQLIIRSAAPTHPFLQLQVFLFPLPTALTHPNPWDFIFNFVCVTVGSRWGDVLDAGNPCALTAPAAPTLSWGAPTAKTQHLQFCLAWTSELRLLPGVAPIKEGRWKKSKSVLLFHHFAMIEISV